MKSRYIPARRALLFWTLFIGLGAVAGATGMLADPTGKSMGMDAMLPYFQKLPFADLLFTDYLFSGVALLTVNGLTNLTAAVLILRKRKSGIVCGGIFGVTLMLWICIQFYMFPPNFMSTIYFIFGFLQAVTGYASWVFYEQERFTVNEADYPNVGTNPERLVVYFSRMGYTKKIALEEANRTGAAIYEIKAKERVEGTLGFWWCGRFGMHRWSMPIEDIPSDLSKYERVTVCSPVWVFSLSAPARAFCKAASGKVKSVEYILVHHQKAKYQNAVREADGLLGFENSPYTSVCCRRGKYIKRETYK